MPRSVQSTVILAKVETTPGTDAAPTNIADAVLVKDFDITLEQSFAQRPIIRSVFGADDMLPTMRRGKIKLVVELQGSGTAATAPQWGDLLLGCAQTESLLATPSRVEYTPTSASLKTLTIWAYKDGLLYKFVYCMGTAAFSLVVGEVPTIEFQFTGLLSVAPAATANPVPTLTAWKRPLAASPVNSAQVILGGAYAAGVVTGGTAYDVRSLSFDLANDVQVVSMITTETVGIYNRASKGNVVLNLAAAAEATQIANMYAGTQTSISLIHGTATGYQVGMFFANALVNKISDQRNGSLFLSSLDLTLLPTSGGNDELRLFQI